MSDPSPSVFIAFLPEWLLLAGVLALFALTLARGKVRAARRVSLITAGAFVVAVFATLNVEAELFEGAYRVDLFSQWLKLVFGLGYLACVLIGRELTDIRSDIRAEYYFLLATAVVGFVLLCGSVDLITLVVALELSSFATFLLIAMRRETSSQRMQMESTVKYMMFGIGASGLMLFGMAYLYGLTGTTNLPLLVERLQPILHTPLALTGLFLTLAAFFYKLAVFPFHFWTPDVYEGASHETTAIIASLPKLAAVLLMVRFVGGVGEGVPMLALLFAVLAVVSMFYGNLLALAQSDLKRLLGFSAIAHAGYTLVGLVTLTDSGYTASLYYVTGYLFMVLACFTVITRVADEGANLPIASLAGLHKRSPLLALTLLCGVFSLAGIPPFVGFMGKFAILTSAFEAGYVWLVLLVLLNAVVAIYYYLRILHAAYFADVPEGVSTAAITLDPASRMLCVGLIVVIVGLGIAPGAFLDLIATSLASVLR
jgi:NADH-quinone oxidoreductase subunit N